ncbi:MAG TPA: permease-like cell division protein FtsX [Bacteroidota bacterium]|nr:permease-like cell division protein FtsX [Bacteroidota bacterium]
MHVGYLLREGLSGFRRAKLSMVAAVFTICISLLLLSFFSILLINANRVIEGLRDKVELEIFLADYLSKEETSALHAQIAALEGVREVRYVSKEEAAEIFRQEFGEDINRVLDFNPLPASFKVFLKDGYKNVAGAENVYRAAKEMKGVEDVIYRKSLLEMLDQRAQTFLWLALGIGVFIAVSAIFLVANTIRLAIYAKRKIIQTMKLIGATRMFIRIPFVLEGLLQGLFGGLLAAAIVFLAFQYLGQFLSIQLTELVSVDQATYGIIVAMGCVLGILGSVLSIRRFIGETVVDQ